MIRDPIPDGAKVEDGMEKDCDPSSQGVGGSFRLDISAETPRKYREKVGHVTAHVIASGMFRLTGKTFPIRFWRGRPPMRVTHEVPVISDDSVPPLTAFSATVEDLPEDSPAADK